MDNVGKGGAHRKQQLYLNLSGRSTFLIPYSASIAPKEHFYPPSSGKHKVETNQQWRPKQGKSSGKIYCFFPNRISCGCSNKESMEKAVSWLMVPLLEKELYQSLDRAVLIHFEDMCVNTLRGEKPLGFCFCQKHISPLCEKKSVCPWKIWVWRQQVHLHRKEEELGGRELIDSQ